MTRSQLIRLCCLTLFPACVAAATPKKLIEFGWDEPDTTFLRQHIAQMEQMPFDGCVFHVKYVKPDGTQGSFLSEAWGKRVFTETELSQAGADLKATPFHRFTHNFFRFNVTPGDVDWFDDFNPILHNAGLAARIASQGKCQGILFDIEQYATPLFDYKHCRDAATKSWEMYATQARSRGREVMTAFQQEFPKVTVFLTYGYSLPWAQTRSGDKPLKETSYGLLAAFLDGMLDATDRRKCIIEGGEGAYAFKDLTKFHRSYQTISEALLPIVAEPKKYQETFSIGFGIWLDEDWRKKGWDPTEPEKNYFTPTAFEASVREALNVSDEYVWIYTEQPRWWSEKGGPEKLPSEYIDALRKARSKPPSR